MTGRDIDRPPQPAAIAAMQLVVFDFDGVFTDNRVYVFEDGREAVCCSRGDGLGIGLLRRGGIEAVVLSSETNPVVSRRAAKLQISCRQGCTDKLAMLHELAAERSVPLARVAYVGNDVNDAGCLQAAGWAVVVRDAHPDVVTLADYRTSARGGQGAVREVCDLLLAARAQI